MMLGLRLCFIREFYAKHSIAAAPKQWETPAAGTKLQSIYNLAVILTGSRLAAYERK